MISTVVSVKRDRYRSLGTRRCRCGQAVVNKAVVNEDKERVWSVSGHISSTSSKLICLNTRDSLKMTKLVNMST